MKLKKNIQLIDQHNNRGFYLNKFGGNFVAETAIKPIEDLSNLFEKLRKNKKFLKKEINTLNITLEVKHLFSN